MTTTTPARPIYFHIMAKPSSFNCNIKCEYCFYLEKERVLSHKVDLMSEEILKVYVKNYIESHGAEEVDFAWQGGEPTLMGLDFFRKAVTYQKNLLMAKKLPIAFKLMELHLIDNGWNYSNRIIF